jgi:two-component sensor histidine kinase
VQPMVGEVATAESQVGLKRKGSFGVVVAEIATPLVMVLAELVQNAIEHAFPAGRSGKVELIVERSARWLDVVIRDNGRGLPAGFSLERSDGLGLQIVRTLVESELRGSLSLRKVHAETSSTRVTGTEAALRIPLSRRL